jgi:catechol 2,3-dioxygenase-like lactoylglutathione lyase family enzyme
MTPRLDAIGVLVSDMVGAVDFYSRLGIEFPEWDEGGHLEAELPGGMRLMLDTEELVTGFDEGFVVPSGPGRVTLAFLCDSPAEVDRIYADITAAGYEGHKEPFDAFWGQRYAIIKDPDGTLVDLFAAL